MKKLFALIAMAIATQSAFAGYESQVRIEKECRNMGEVAEMAYQLRKQGEAYDDDKYDPGKVTGAQKVLFEGGRYGYYEATDAKDAYMRGWAKCMDYFSKLTR